ncbi:MAG: right-handed parallel beta-helix repeat-containing protein [Candidatus Krumholzibacteriota bacterium]|nr:right-handed parallel beta-helix repeat-containing protein [Candidatus Krumholzibacteriota bacterium]
MIVSKTNKYSILFMVFVILITHFTSLGARIVHVTTYGSDEGDGSIYEPYASIPKAIDELCAYDNPSPGDTIYVHEGTYPNEPVSGNWDPYGQYGTYIWIMGVPGENKPRLTRGETAYITSYKSAETPPHNFALKRLIFDKDDVGYHNINMCSWNPLSIAPPIEQGYIHNVIIDSCEFYNRRKSAAGIKMSGVDSFVIKNCTFNGFDGGGIGLNMDGCHYGEVYNNTFYRERMSGILTKGGSHHIVIRNNFIKDCSPIGIAVGGDTWYEYCRPDTAQMEDPLCEARDIDAYSNVIIDCWIPIVFNCSRDSRVYNNQIIITDSLKNMSDSEGLIFSTTPGMIQFRETSGWCNVPPRDNKIYNNIFYFNKIRDYYYNIYFFLPNETHSDRYASTIKIWNNLWYEYEDPSSSWKSWNSNGVWNCVDTTGVNIYAQDPRFVKNSDGIPIPTNGYSLGLRGIRITPPSGYEFKDFYGETYMDPPPIGAINISYEPEGPPIAPLMNRLIPANLGEKKD